MDKLIQKRTWQCREPDTRESGKGRAAGATTEATRGQRGQHRVQKRVRARAAHVCQPNGQGVWRRKDRLLDEVLEHWGAVSVDTNLHLTWQEKSIQDAS